jgi:hypothetical protein
MQHRSPSVALTRRRFRFALSSARRRSIFIAIQHSRRLPVGVTDDVTAGHLVGTP